MRMLLCYIYNKIDPISDAGVVEMELIFADIINIKNRLLKLEKKSKTR